MHHYTARETEEMLPYDALAREIAEVLRDKARGAATAPERMHLSLAKGGTLLVMPASDQRLAMTKLVTVHPANTGLPTIQGEVLVMDAATGRRLGLLDGPAVTARRTAALSLLAAQHLAPSTEGPLLVVGAGTQARAHVQAFVQGQGVKSVLVASRTVESARALVEHARELGLEAGVAESVEQGLEQCSLVVTATTSVEPVLPETVPDDTFIAAVGAFRPNMAELPPGLMRRARVYVDTLEGGLTEAGDVIRAGLGPDDLTSLEAVLDSKPKAGPGPVVFKSTGHALFDLAACRLAFS